MSQKPESGGEEAIKKETVEVVRNDVENEPSGDESFREEDTLLEKRRKGKKSSVASAMDEDDEDDQSDEEDEDMNLMESRCNFSQLLLTLMTMISELILAVWGFILYIRSRGFNTEIAPECRMETIFNLILTISIVMIVSLITRCISSGASVLFGLRGLHKLFIMLFLFIQAVFCTAIFVMLVIVIAIYSSSSCKDFKANLSSIYVNTYGFSIMVALAFMLCMFCVWLVIFVHQIMRSNSPNIEETSEEFIEDAQ